MSMNFNELDKVYNKLYRVINNPKLRVIQFEKQLEQELAQGFLIDHVPKTTGYTLLQWAIVRGELLQEIRKSIVLTLLNNGADVNLTVRLGTDMDKNCLNLIADNYYRTNKHIPSYFDEVLHKTKNINNTSMTTGLTALGSLCEWYYAYPSPAILSAIKKLLDTGADPDAGKSWIPDKYMWPKFYEAAIKLRDYVKMYQEQDMKLMKSADSTYEYEL